MTTDNERLATEAARRLAARSQWQKALVRARERFTPSAMQEELIEKAADTVAGIADETVRLAWAHKGKVAAVSALAAVVAARKPIAKALSPLVGKIKARIGRTGSTGDYTD